VYPDKKGLITGLGVAGFGFGALIWIYLAGNWGHLLNLGVLKVFLIYGIIFAVAVIGGSTWMVNPPDGYAPKGWKAPQPAGKGKARAKRTSRWTTSPKKCCGCSPSGPPGHVHLLQHGRTNDDWQHQVFWH
jgi:hypothetical protein